MSLRLRAHAKVNLALRVGAPRDDGYHPVATIFQTVSLADRLRIGRAEPERAVSTRPGSPPALDLSVSGASLPGENTLNRAAELVAERLWDRGVSHVPALAADLDKRIPIGAGLGGGSSDGAATLVACARLWGLEGPGLGESGLEGPGLGEPGLEGPGSDESAPGQPGSDEAGLDGLARRIGADVPFFLQGGTVLGTGRGDELEPVEPLERSWLALVAPRLQVGTAEAYAEFDRRRPDAGEPDTPAYRPRPGASWIGNDLEAVVESAFPPVGDARRALEELCPGPVRMTGSGAASFGVFAGRREACRAARRLRDQGWWAEACVTVDRQQHRRALTIPSGP